MVKRKKITIPNRDGFIGQAKQCETLENHELLLRIHESIPYEQRHLNSIGFEETVHSIHKRFNDLNERRDIMSVNKETLLDYEDNAAEIKHNNDGSVTFIFDDQGKDPETGAPLSSSTTVSKEDYDAVMSE